MGQANRRKAADLWTCLGVQGRQHVALVGGGGKTSLMLALAEELQSRGLRVISGTTTKIALHEAAGAPLRLNLGTGEPPWDEIAAGLARCGHLMLAGEEMATGKVRGISAAQADLVFARAPADCVVLEADGASQRPLKAPAEHEPVIPASTTLVIGLIGLDALGAPIEPRTVFRVRQFEAATGRRRGETVDSAALAALVCSPVGIFKGSPPGVRRAVFLNKADRLQDKEAGREVCGRILESALGEVERVILASLRQKAYEIWRCES